MIRVLTYDAHVSGRSRLRLAVDAALMSFGASNHGITPVSSSADLIETFQRMRRGYFELIVCWIGPDADEMFDALSAIRRDDESVHIVLIAPDGSFAARALELGVEGFCLEKDGPEGLKRAMERPVAQVLGRRGDVMGLRFDIGVGNVVLDEVVFAESTKKGSVIHLANGGTRLVRSTLQALFDKLAGRGPFEKAGSSFIVNLDNIRSTGDGAVIFSNGESIVVPVRVRKPLADTLRLHNERA